MKKVTEWLSNIDKDKWMHFTICLIVSLLVGIEAKFLFPELSAAEIACASWIVGWLVGFGKEIYDEIKYKGSDPYDWAADFLGSTLGTLIVLLL